MGPEKDPSGTDQLWTTVRIMARSLLYVNQLTGIGIIPAELGTDQNVAQLLTRIRHLLTAPRRALYYDFLSLPGTTAGLPPSAIINLPDGTDDANGPWPDESAFSVVYTTYNCLEVTWACTVRIRDCGLGVPDGPISLRWEDSLTFDNNFKATYRRVGTCIISRRSPVLMDEVRRNTIAPRVAPGFRRTSSNYTLSRDGLRCDFMFQDEQLRFAPPYPASKMEITQSETFPLVGGMRQGEVTVAMSGFQNANVRDLAFWAMTVCKSKVWASTPLQTPKGVVVGTKAPPIIRVRETEESVDVVVTIPYQSPPKQTTELQSGPGNGFWGGLIGFAIGGPTGLLLGSGIGGLSGGTASPTKEGRDPTTQPVFPWIGAGTSPPSAVNPLGFAPWANVTGSLVGPADGVGLAPAVSLFAALLQDPCGAELRSVPNASDPTVTLRTNVNIYNTPSGGGQGGDPPVYDAQLTASVSQFPASQYPSVPTGSGNTSLYSFDNEPGVYDFWQCADEYHEDPGVIVLPTCNPSGTNIAIRHSSQMLMLRRRWAASRTGAPPAIPPKDLNNVNLIYTGGYVAPSELRVAADGVSVQYEVCGVYEYYALDASLVNKLACIPPFLSEAALVAQSDWLTPTLELTGSLTSGVLSLFGLSGGSILGSIPLLNQFPP